jgi:hypothetical protein
MINTSKVKLDPLQVGGKIWQGQHPGSIQHLNGRPYIWGNFIRSTGFHLPDMQAWGKIL